MKQEKAQDAGCHRAKGRNFQKELDALLEAQETTRGKGKKRLLLHCCCAPCSSYVLEYLHPYFDITIFFYNPNITEEPEYVMRKKELERYLSEVSFGAEIHRIDADYEPDLFFQAAKGYEDCPERGERCGRCFALRLEETAKKAAEGAYDYFCTTLSISPHKDAVLLMETGERYAERYGVPYLPSDFKKKNGYKRSIELSGEYHLYRQDYCGCVFSKRARHIKKSLATVFLLCGLCASLLAGCRVDSGTAPGQGGVRDEDSARAQREIFAMDTIMDITVYGSGADEALEQAVALATDYEKLFSVTDPDSDIARLNAADGEAVTVSEETSELIGYCQEMSELTGGLFDISIYPLVRAWGFTTEQMHVPSGAERELALSRIDYRKIRREGGNRIQIPKDMQLDLGAAAKGYLSQKMMELFQGKKDVDAAIVSLGGNVQTIGNKEDGSEFVVGITDPSDGASVYGTLSVADRAVVTSGIYQRYFEEGGVRYHHIMDKRTGMPAENSLASVTVIAEKGWMADALATALYVMGEEKAIAFQKEHPEMDIILIRKDGSYWQSAGAGMERVTE